MIPAGGIVQTADHMDAVGGDEVVTVIQVVLLGREHRDRRSRLLTRIRRLLCSSEHHAEENLHHKSTIAHTHPR